MPNAYTGGAANLIGPIVAPIGAPLVGHGLISSTLVNPGLAAPSLAGGIGPDVDGPRSALEGVSGGQWIPDVSANGQSIY